MFQESFKGVSRKFQGCCKEFSSKLKGYFTEVSRMFQESFKGVSRKFQGCVMEVSRVFQECCRGLYRKFKGF